MSESTNKFAKIYGILDPNTNEVVYIGKANNVKARLKTHISDCRKKRSNLYTWMQQQINDNKTIKIVELASSLSDDWQSLEKIMIAQYKSDHELLNMASGGNEPPNTIEVRRKNAINLNQRRKEDPFFQKIWLMKRAMGQYLKLLSKPDANPEKYKSIVAKLKYAADKRPDLFGCWSNL